MFKRLLAGLALTGVLAQVVSAQVAIPNTLVSGTTIRAADLNTNFSTLGSRALDRVSGGNITGNITMDPGITIDGLDIGATLCPTCTAAFKDLSLVSPATGLTVNSNVIINATGKIPAITSTYFTALSFDAANLTGTVATARLGSGVADATTFLRGDGSWQLAVPQNAVLFFEAACPSGYTDLSATYGGRTVVILPSGGTLSAQVGTALTDAENRATGIHNHSATTTITAAATGVTASMNVYANSGGGSQALQSTGASPVTMSPGITITDPTHTHPASTTVNNSSGVAGTNAPYVQLRACRKN